MRHPTTDDYDTWRAQAPTLNRNWQPQFNKGLAPVGVLLWVKEGSKIHLARRISYVESRSMLPEYEILSVLGPHLEVREVKPLAGEWAIY